MNNLGIKITLLMILLAMVCTIWISYDMLEDSKRYYRNAERTQALDTQEIYWMIQDLNVSCPQTTTQIRLTQYQDNNLFFEELARRFSENHNYTFGIYDCTEYSRDFKFILDNLGFDSSIKVARLNKTSSMKHAWNEVCFDVESITGQVVNYK